MLNINSQNVSILRYIYIYHNVYVTLIFFKLVTTKLYSCRRLRNSGISAFDSKEFYYLLKYENNYYQKSDE